MLAIYTRISKEDRNDDGISLDNQKNRGVILANKLGLKFKVYEDEGKSGSLSVVKRPQLNQIFNDITSKTITTVYVLNQSRLDRGDLIQWLTIIKFFKDNKTKLYINEVHQDLTNVSTELTLNVMALVNNNYLKQATENIKSALVENIRQGKASGGPIIKYGYQKNAITKVLEINEVEAKTVRLVYKLAIEQKLGGKAIASELDRRGIPTKRGNITTGKGMMVKGEKRTEFHWTSAVIHSILSSTMYKGVRFYQGQNYDCPAIIDAVSFEYVRELMKGRSKFKDTTNTTFYLLKGLIDCPVCRGTYFGKQKVAHVPNIYTCNSKRDGRSCGNRGINVQYLDKLVLDSIMNLENIINMGYDNKELVEKSKKFTSALKINQSKKVELQKQKSNIVKLVLSGKIDEDDIDFKETLDKLTKEIADNLLSETRHKKELTIIEQKDYILEVAKQGVAQFKKIKNEKEKANFISILIQNIYILWNEENRHYEIEINFKINHLENYLVTKKLMIQRDGKNSDFSTVTKILSESVSIQSMLLVGDEDGIRDPMIDINFGVNANSIEYTVHGKDKNGKALPPKYA